MTPNDSQNSVPLFVDLDGTLIHSDLLVESFLELIKKNILFVFLIPFWLLKGKAWLKHQIASRTEVRVDLLPYNEALMSFLREEKASGRELILISASNQKLVEEVAAHTGVFDRSIGSDLKTNCSQTGKLRAIQRITGSRPFDYAGNASVDLVIWAQARYAIVVDAGRRLRRRASAVATVSREFDRRLNRAALYVQSLRLHQWLKNTLIFLPLILAHRFNEPQLILQAALAFICFSFCASSVYLLNDLIDLPSDRQHHTKFNRPLAAGAIPLTGGMLLSITLLVLAFAASLLLPLLFTLVLAAYYCSTFLYSFVLKKIVMVDVITLATLYTLRIIAGAAAVTAPPTFWLLAFSMFLFLSLAMVKRYTELGYLKEMGVEQSEGRGYYARDLEMMSTLGSASAFMSVMVFALYINSEDILEQYPTPEILWLICPLLLYLMSRTWLLAYRGMIEEDPIVFALKDRVSQWVTLTSALLLWIANLDWDIVIQMAL